MAGPPWLPPVYAQTPPPSRLQDAFALGMPVTDTRSAVLLKHIDITARIVVGTVLTVLGVALVLIG